MVKWLNLEDTVVMVPNIFYIPDHSRQSVFATHMLK